MGCSSSIQSSPSVPSKKKPDFLLQPFSNLRILSQKLSVDEVQILAGSDANSLKLLTSPHIIFNHFLMFKLKKLGNFVLNGEKINPAISYIVKSLDPEKKFVHFEEKYEAVKEASVDQDVDIKIHNEKCDAGLYEITVKVRDKNDKTMANLLQLVYKFRVVNEMVVSNIQETFEKKTSIYNEINCHTFGEINVSNLELLINDQQINPPYEIKFGSQLFIHFSSLHGLKKKGHYISLGCSVSLFDDIGQEIYFKEDIFPSDAEYHEEDVSDLRFFVSIGGDNFKPESNYFFTVRIWDKLAPSILSLSGKYKSLDGFNFKARVLQINGGQAQLKGNEGCYYDRKILFIKGDKDNMNILEKNMDNVVDMKFAYDEGKKGENILHMTTDGKDRKPTFWKLLEVEGEKK